MSYDYKCCHQQITQSGVICDIASIVSGPQVLDVAKICRECEIGLIYRNTKCKKISGSVEIMQQSGDMLSGIKYFPNVTKIICLNDGKNTNSEKCRNCSEKSV